MFGSFLLISIVLSTTPNVTWTQHISVDTDAFICEPPKGLCFLSTESNDSDDSSRTKAIRLSDGSVKWQTNLSAVPTVVGDQICFQIWGKKHSVSCVSQITGKVSWSAHTGKSIVLSASDGNLLIVNLDEKIGSFQLYNSKTGTRRWSVNLNKTISNWCKSRSKNAYASVMIDDEITMIIAFRLSDGEVIWRKSLPEATLMQLGCDSDVILIMNRGMGLMRLASASGRTLWSHKIDSLEDERQIHDGALAIVNDADGNSNQLQMLNMETGKILWSYPKRLNLCFIWGFYCIDEVCFIAYSKFGSENFIALAVDSKTGKQLYTPFWMPDSGNPFTSVNNGSALLPSGGDIISVKIKTGEKLWTTPCSCSRFGIYIDGDTAYAASTESISGAPALIGIDLVTGNMKWLTYLNSDQLSGLEDVTSFEVDIMNWKYPLEDDVKWVFVRAIYTYTPDPPSPPSTSYYVWKVVGVN